MSDDDQTRDETEETVNDEPVQEAAIETITYRRRSETS